MEEWVGKGSVVGQGDPVLQTCISRLPFSQESSNFEVSPFFQHLANCQKVDIATSMLSIVICELKMIFQGKSNTKELLRSLKTSVYR